MGKTSTVLVALLIVGCVVALESTISAPTADEMLATASKAVSKDYFYLGSSYLPARVIKYATQDASRQQHVEYNLSQNISTINELALSSDASTLYALMNTTMKNYFAISKINTKDMSSLGFLYTTMPLPQVDKMFVTSQYLCIVGGSTLLRYSLNGEFVDSTIMVGMPFETVDTINGIIYLQSSTGIDRLVINTLEKLPTIPVDWKTIPATKDSLTKINDVYYIVENGITDPEAVGNWKLHSIGSNNAITSSNLGTWKGPQPQIVPCSLAVDKIVIMGSASVSDESLNSVTCIIDPVQVGISCYGSPFGSNSENTIHVSVTNQYHILPSILIQLNLLTRAQKYIQYSPNNYQLRDNSAMAVVGDQLFFCSTESMYQGLVALNLVTGTIQTTKISCSQLLAYNNKIYVNKGQASIVSFDVNTMQETIIDANPIPDSVRSAYCWHTCFTLRIYTVQGKGLFYTSYPTSNNMTFNKINDDGTKEVVDCTPEAKQSGICYSDFHVEAHDEEYLYAVPTTPFAAPIRKTFRYKIGSDTPIFYDNDPATLCNFIPFTFILDPRNTPEKKYGYLACNNVIKFDLHTGEIQETYLEGENFGAKTMAFHGDELWISGTTSSTFKVISNSAIASVDWKAVLPSAADPTSSTATPVVAGSTANPVAATPTVTPTTIPSSANVNVLTHSLLVMAFIVYSVL